MSTRRPPCHHHPNGSKSCPCTERNFGKPKAFTPLRDLDIAPNPNYFQNGMYASYVQWHPLVVTSPLTLTIVMRWSSTSCAMVPMPSISCAGRAAQGQRPYSGQFTPDGRFTSPPTGCVISSLSPPLSSGCQRRLSVARLAMLGQRRPAQQGSFPRQLVTSTLSRYHQPDGS